MEYRKWRLIVSDVHSPHGLTIAIDGPAGSGKSTIAKLLARRLGIGYLDTGAMYRSLTLIALESGVDLDDHDAVAALLPSLDLHADSNPDDPHFFVGNREVTSLIRSSIVSEAVSKISTNLLVRAWMVEHQRQRMAEASSNGSGMVAEGRDITTVVYPEADLRVLLVASPLARMKRRAKELFGDDSPESLEKVRSQIVDRDAADSTVSEFTNPGPGIELVDTSDLDIEGVLEAVISLLSAGMSGNHN